MYMQLPQSEQESCHLNFLLFFFFYCTEVSKLTESLMLGSFIFLLYFKLCA